MEFSAEQIAGFIDGKVQGDKNVKVNNVCKIEQGSEGKLAFLANEKYNHYLYDTKASIVIVNDSLVLEKPVKTTLIRVKDAYSCFAKLLEIYNQYKFARTGISSLSFVGEGSTLGEDCYLGEFAVIDKNVTIGQSCKIYPQVYVGQNVKIGNNVTLFAGVKIYHDVTIGDNCIIHSGCVIGADGFGFAPLEDGSFKKIPQIGDVVIEQDVELGANTCVDRSTMGTTLICKGTKIDNLCQIAHNTTIGNSTVMSAQTGLAGSTQIGSYCFIGGQVGFAGHLKVGNKVKIGGQSGIISDVEDGATILGTPAINARDFMKNFAYTKKLSEMEKRLRAVENQLKQKENNNNAL